LDDALAERTLVAYSLEFEHADKRWADAVRQDCLEYLMASGRPVSVIPYVEALKSKDNVIVNRAGEALARIGDAAAISPLIDALVTSHKYQVAPQGPGMTTSFSPDGTGGGGFSVGGRPKIETVSEENPAVLQALKKLSGGQNFDYDKVAWRRWYVDLLMRQHTNARRDE
jgi:HEAT repeat protein